MFVYIYIFIYGHIYIYKIYLIYIWSCHLQTGTILLLASQFGCPLFIFSCLITLARTFGTILTRNGESGHSSPVPDLRGKAFSLSLFVYDVMGHPVRFNLSLPPKSSICFPALIILFYIRVVCVHTFSLLLVRDNISLTIVFPTTSSGFLYP